MLSWKTFFATITCNTGFLYFSDLLWSQGYQAIVTQCLQARKSLLIEWERSVSKSIEWLESLLFYSDFPSHSDLCSDSKLVLMLHKYTRPGVSSIRPRWSLEVISLGPHIPSLSQRDRWALLYFEIMNKICAFLISHLQLMFLCERKVLISGHYGPC